jgi:hypothetical protein
MARKIIDIGVIGNDGTGDSIRDSFRKVNDNFRELYSSLGLGERLTFVGLSDTPESYAGQYDPVTNNTPFVTINDTESGLTFKKLVPGSGISIKFTDDEDLEGPDQIIINSVFTSIVSDPAPRLGGALNALSGATGPMGGATGPIGGTRFPIGNLPDIRSTDEVNDAMSKMTFAHGALLNGTEDRLAVNKGYADSKIARAGVNAVNPTTGLVDSSFGRMSGPLILSRSPEPDDDELYGGLVAATKQYVDNAAFGSVANLFVAISGQDDRPGLSKTVQGRALAYAFRTIEAACKRAEELVLESRDEIGPYKKVLTYNNGANDCTLTSITSSPDSGVGFQGTVRLSVDSAELIAVGANYYPGDIVTVIGGTGSSATIEILATTATPGAISSYKILSSGSYSVLPNSNPATIMITTSAAPEDIGAIGAGAEFKLTYKINSVAIVNGGSDYSLVSVRITGGGGSGAFGTAVVTGGAVSSITITDTGSGFTSIPTLTVDLPRFAINTEGFRTDFTGDVDSNDPIATRTRDIREGLFLRGETSGALAQILNHSGELDINGNELFDVDVKFGSFAVGEVIAYGDVTKNIQITIIVESGVYEENLPIKVPQNTSIVGDEFRRCIIRPRPGISSSPWAFQKFRRDLTIGTGERIQPEYNAFSNDWVEQQTTGDLLIIANRLYGYHYLTDSSNPVYTKINNKGEYRSSATLLELNRTFLQEEIIAWMTDNIATATVGSTWYEFTYNRNLCKRDVGLIIDALVFDLKWGDYNRTVSAGLKYYQSASAEIAITEQLEQYLLVIDRLEILLQSIIDNEEIEDISQDLFLQIIDPAFQSEAGSDAVINSLIAVLKEIMDGIENNDDPSRTVNLPKNNDGMDVFLANDACRWQGITCQGHGGFMLVLDPTGQVLAKSPYAQECASFSRSTGRQTFAGGKFVDGFAGNLQFLHETTVSGTNNTRVTVAGLDRFPNLPASFLVDEAVFRINYVRDYVYNPAGSTATFVLDETTPFSRTAGAQVCTISNSDPVVINRIDHRLQAGATIKFAVSEGGSLPAGIIAGQEYYVIDTDITNNTFRITDEFGSIMPVATFSEGSGTFTYQRVYELLMPGNRSMLSNDFTQINDLGYGLVAQNGGLIEAVSMFTYYCHISYYSVNGGQIRSIGGSSAHGNYALVAQGADPLEVPTPTNLFEDLSQSVNCYGSGEFANNQGDLFLFVYKYDYTPMSNSELEVNHIVDGAGNIYRYPITSVTTSGVDPDPLTGLPVARLNLGSGAEGVNVGEDGLFRAIPDGTKMTIRQSSQTILTGGLIDVAVRPSTGLKLQETGSTVYRVLQFENYVDTNGPYEVDITIASPAVITVLAEIIEIDSNICTTSQNHKLKRGDRFRPLTSSNGLTSGTNYFVIDVPEYNQFILSTTANGSSPTLVNGTGLSIKGVKPHKLLENYTINFNVPTVELTGTISGTTLTVVSISSGTLVAGMILSGIGITEETTIVSGSGSTWTLSISHTISSTISITATGELPHPLAAGITYYVISSGVSATEFRVSTIRNGNAVNTTSAGIGNTTYSMNGLTRANLRENYDYIDLTVFRPGEFISSVPLGTTCTISIGNPAVVTLTGHGFVEGSVIKFTTTDRLPSGISPVTVYHVLGGASLTVNSFTFSIEPAGDPVISLGTQSGTQRVGLITGRAGDTVIAVVPISTLSIQRVVGSKFAWLGEEYIIESYDSEIETNAEYGRVILDRPLENSIINFASSYTIKAAVPIRSLGANGTLTIRISLTRVTSHDLLEIGTGSYADTNYPNEIYGPSVNSIDESQEVEERDVGRVFYVTTDQFGNFSVGPFFRVDQGTGTVTFAASISLSNLDGIGFKRGVPISEFSTDNTFSDNATDTVPTENATRIYIERRLGLTHSGAAVAQSQLIPAITGGFLALNGSLPMKGNLNLSNFNITSLADPVSTQDAVNLRSLTFNNFQDITLTGTSVNQLLVYTGISNQAINATVTGDIALTVNSGTNTVNAQIVANTIVNADINSSAAIAQSKLNMNSATVRANATGIVQADRGLASFKSTEFTVTNGWVELQTSTTTATGVTLNKLQRISGSTVVGNASGGVANATAVPFATVVNDGLAIKKSQYSTTGFLRRNNLADTQDAAWSIQEASSLYSDPADNGKIITRTGTAGISGGGDFGARDATLRRMILSSQSSTGDSLATTNNVALAAWDTNVSTNAGYNRLYGFKSKGGVLVFSGNNPDQNKTAYWNDAHFFLTQSGGSPAPIDCSVVRTTTLSTGSNTAAGTIIGRWTLSGDPSTSGSRLQATYSADLAEYYEGDKTYEVGTVLVFGGDKEVTTSTKHADNRVAGVVSDTAAFAMYEACPGEKNLIALQGRVPVKVVGKIRKGDMLVTSGIAGVAVAVGDDVKVGTVIGKALVDYDSDHIGTIEVAVGRT